MRYGIFIEAAVVFAVAVLFAVGSYFLRPEALPPMQQDTPSASTGADATLYQLITFEQAQKMHAEGRALFADARPIVAYEQGHIPGALHLDPHEMDRWIDSLMANTPPDTPIVAYCEGINCQLSRELSEKLTWMGFEEVYYVVDGWGKWKTQDLPVE